MTSTLSPADYHEILGAYLHTHSEDALYRASLLSQVCIETGLGPEDIIALHFEALDPILDTLSHREQARAHGDAQQFLLEVMIAYGVKYKEYLELKLSESLRDANARAGRERERATAAERMQREKDEIWGVISHELRTPITAAQGNLDLASRVLGRGEVEPVPQLLSKAMDVQDAPGLAQVCLGRQAQAPRAGEVVDVRAASRIIDGRVAVGPGVVVGDVVEGLDDAGRGVDVFGCADPPNPIPARLA